MGPQFPEIGEADDAVPDGLPGGQSGWQGGGKEDPENGRKQEADDSA